MAKAPTNTTTRRHLFTVAAGGAVAAAIPADARASPGHVTDPIFAAIEAHRSAAAVEQLAWNEVNGRPGLSVDDERAITDGPGAAAYDALELAATVPTTLPGLRSMILYANELEAEHTEPFSDCDLLETLATAAKALLNSSGIAEAK
ncbi:MAG TPA: hypothetical protein VNX23_24150 [Bradyrhizobium sp.]|jgi:hypothetical protein|uniref:hypothetical protein n=1 Tax=Bradyrhizobium sp. TaxID=376 RepID=UPI002BFA5CE3|nr:hypothetical protein [Bradyrhizobium sp.]HXB80460.1 hypothetical protein [Bradyrhizobium sp.]